MSSPPTPPPSRWTSHPLREESPVKSALLILFILALSAAAGASFGHLIYGLLTFGILAGCMSRYFVPTLYECDAEGLSMAHLGSRRRMAWEAVGRVVPFPDGVFLSPFEQPCRMDRFQGHFVRCRRNPDAVGRIQEHVASVKQKAG